MTITDTKNALSPARVLTNDNVQSWSLKSNLATIVEDWGTNREHESPFEEAVRNNKNPEYVYLKTHEKNSMRFIKSLFDSGNTSEEILAIHGQKIIKRVFNSFYDNFSNSDRQKLGYLADLRNANAIIQTNYYRTYSSLKNNVFKCDRYNSAQYNSFEVLYEFFRKEISNKALLRKVKEAEEMRNSSDPQYDSRILSMGVAFNINNPNFFNTELLKTDIVDVRRTLAMNQVTNYRILEELSNDKDDITRLLVAKHGYANDNVLLKLSEDENEIVSLFAFEKINVPVEELEEMSKSKNVMDLRKVAWHSNSSYSVLMNLYNCEDEMTRFLAYTNYNTPSMVRRLF